MKLEKELKGICFSLSELKMLSSDFWYPPKVKNCVDKIIWLLAEGRCLAPKEPIINRNKFFNEIHKQIKAKLRNAEYKIIDVKIDNFNDKVFVKFKI